MDTQDINSSQRSPSLLAAGNNSDIYCEAACETNFNIKQTNQCEPNGPHSNDEKNQNDSHISKNPSDHSEFSALSADNRTKATLPQNGVNNDCAAPNCNIEAAGILKESVKQPSNSKTYQCVSPSRDRAASDLSLSPRSVADTLIRTSRAESTDVESGQQNLRSKHASSRPSRSQTRYVSRNCRSQSRTRPPSSSNQILDSNGTNSRKTEKKT